MYKRQISFYDKYERFRRKKLFTYKKTGFIPLPTEAGEFSGILLKSQAVRNLYKTKFEKFSFFPFPFLYLFEFLTVSKIYHNFFFWSIYDRFILFDLFILQKSDSFLLKKTLALHLILHRNIVIPLNSNTIQRLFYFRLLSFLKWLQSEIYNLFFLYI